jgi:hypothetical protein
MHRVDLELRRISSATVRLGGAMKVVRGLERLLSAVLTWMASVDGFDPLLAVREIDPHASTIDRTTMTNIVRTILRRSEAPGATAHTRAEIATLISDLADKKNGRIMRLINARNDVVHGRRVPEAQLPPASAVVDLLRERAAKRTATAAGAPAPVG